MDITCLLILVDLANVIKINITQFFTVSSVTGAQRRRFLLNYTESKCYKSIQQSDWNIHLIFNVHDVWFQSFLGPASSIINIVKFLHFQMLPPGAGCRIIQLNIKL